VKHLLIFLSIFIWKSSLAESEKPKTNVEEEVEVLEFDKLNNVLKQDKLDIFAKEKQLLAKKIAEQRKLLEQKKYYYPKEDKFWSMLSEMWCVKNALYLKWDFEKADLGIGINFKKFMESLSLSKKRVKILILESMNVAHIALPADENSYIFLISLPFMRAMDLTKREISILLLEDMIRADKAFFKSALSLKEAKEKFGTVMKNNKPDLKYVKQLLDEYSDIALQRGFNFQQQYEVTKFMDNILKTKSEYWESYLTLTQKRDLLVKTNEGFSWYSRFYPSPEMQLTWLQPVHVKSKFQDMKKP
jgi:hypothetical protein